MKFILGIWYGWVGDEGAKVSVKHCFFIGNFGQQEYKG